MEKTTGNRIIWIDWAKAILIYLMVVGHCNPSPWQGTLIYAFHMPAFFMISGYLYHEHHWLKTVKTFLIPIFFFSIINFMIFSIPKFIKGTFTTDHLFERIFMPFWASGSLPSDDYIILFPGVWFIISLLLGRLMMGDIKMMSWVTRYWKVVFFVLIIFLTIEPFLFPNNPLQDYKFYLVIPSLPFFLLGYGLKGYINFERIKSWMVIIGFAVFVSISLMYGRAEILGCHYGPFYILYFINAVLGGGLLFYVCSRLRQSRIIELISKGTLLVMAFNLVLYSFINVFIYKIGLGFIDDDNLFFPWLKAMLIMIICYLPIKLLIKYAPLLLGK